VKSVHNGTVVLHGVTCFSRIAVGLFVSGAESMYYTLRNSRWQGKGRKKDENPKNLRIGT
jgi:hypothetical protein